MGLFKKKIMDPKIYVGLIITVCIIAILIFIFVIFPNKKKKQGSATVPTTAGTEVTKETTKVSEEKVKMPTKISEFESVSEELMLRQT